METKLMAMILGVTLVLATAAVYTQSAFAFRANPGCGDVGLPCPPGGGNGVTDGQTAHGLATACSHSHAADHNPNCSGTRPNGETSTNTNNGGNAAAG